MREEKTTEGAPAAFCGFGFGPLFATGVPTSRINSYNLLHGGVVTVKDGAVSNLTNRKAEDRNKMKSASSELLVMTVPEAGAKLGLGRNAAYEAAANGEIPTIRIGKLIKVPKAALERMLENVSTSRRFA
ncbi:helix-turn-helix domain-containing protein [Mesorhizobium sp. M8A.F.Ca.ET.057.01.1.1]|uniref:helix-turn-helix domain-containing protein n=1 Tax=Mesorhizobium sp. M8A.F.Ca.ET.057.01.1.1 TaxID=2493679 RepID=UPI001FDEC7AC|nr:helix-turn-helix domain-containing protein [Mesorhizobium sp. M8A.F.Ca.ET.057.01.1.1]